MDNEDAAATKTRWSVRQVLIRLQRASPKISFASVALWVALIVSIVLLMVVWITTDGSMQLIRLWNYMAGRAPLTTEIEDSILALTTGCFVFVQVAVSLVQLALARHQDELSVRQERLAAQQLEISRRQDALLNQRARLWIDCNAKQLPLSDDSRTFRRPLFIIASNDGDRIVKDFTITILVPPGVILTQHGSSFPERLAISSNESIGRDWMEYEYDVRLNIYPRQSGRTAMTLVPAWEAHTVLPYDGPTKIYWRMVCEDSRYPDSFFDFASFGTPAPWLPRV